MRVSLLCPQYPSTMFAYVSHSVEYVCPKCHHFNASARLKKQPQGKSLPSATSPRSSTFENHPPAQNGSPHVVETQEMAQAPDTTMMEIDES